MKVLICTIFLFSVILQDAAYAHQGHDFISSNTAISIASKSVKQQTFKDFGYAVGKLDASWKSLNDANFNMLEVLKSQKMAKCLVLRELINWPLVRLIAYLYSNP
jgi:hypothetical protein